MSETLQEFGASFKFGTVSAVDAKTCRVRVRLPDLDNLRTAGWAELTPKGDRWRLTPHVIQISLRYATALNAGAQQWRDVQQRYGRAVGELNAIN